MVALAAGTSVLLAIVATTAPALAQAGGPSGGATTTTAPGGQQGGAGEEPESEGGEEVRGRLEDRVDGELTPVEGVKVTVATATGEEVGTAVSDDEGEFRLALPGPGQYVATLDESTLPKGVRLRTPGANTRTFSINVGQSRPLLFPLGIRARQTTGDFDRGLQLLVEGVKFGLLIAMAAVGLSLIYGTTGLVNFAHGEIVTFGAMMAWIANQLLDVQLIPAALAAVVVTAIAAGLLDVGVWRPLRRRGTGLIAAMVVSIGLSFLLRHLFLYQFGGRTRPYGDYTLQRATQLGPVEIAPKDIFSIALSLIVLIGFGLLLQRTRWGKATRAVADNPELAASSGIDVDKVVRLVWTVGGGLAALGGVLLGVAEQVGFQMGFQLLLLMFAGITLGGLGTAYGALLGCFVVGMLVQVSTLWISSELKTVGALVVLILILLVRPQGILGQAERVG
ncbi:MAG: branched-chain amino acid ABC transporter permease [Actinobacteria bacterium]|nr:MAG: branched-chain amino acid ABC transporter permease [Actinomycetota bacterium]